MLKTFVLTVSCVAATPSLAQDARSEEAIQDKQAQPPADPDAPVSDDAAPGKKRTSAPDAAPADAAPSPNPPPATEAAQPTPSATPTPSPTPAPQSPSHQPTTDPPAPPPEPR